MSQFPGPGAGAAPVFASACADLVPVPHLPLLLLPRRGPPALTGLGLSTAPELPVVKEGLDLPCLVRGRLLDVAPARCGAAGVAEQWVSGSLSLGPGSRRRGASHPALLSHHRAHGFEPPACVPQDLSGDSPSAGGRASWPRLTVQCPSSWLTPLSLQSSASRLTVPPMAVPFLGL